MERIEALIKRLKEQVDANADPSILLGTVQLLQFELTKMNKTENSGLSTSKVAVVLPVTQVSVIAPAMNYDKYAPQPPEPLQTLKEEKLIYSLDLSSEEIEEKIPVTERKETLLFEEGSVSVVQKNGQLGILFDPMTEIPTLAAQIREKEVNDRGINEESLNDKLNQGKAELIEVLKETPVKDLRKAIGINDRYLFINHLFRGDENMYERCIKTINSFNIYAEAEYWITRELSVKLGWKDDEHEVQQFYHLVKRRFS